MGVEVLTCGKNCCGKRKWNKKGVVSGRVERGGRVQNGEKMLMKMNKRMPKV